MAMMFKSKSLVHSLMIFSSSKTLWCRSDLESKPTGILEVKLVQAKDLSNKDIVGKSDPFAVLFVRPLPEKTKTSKTIVRNTYLFPPHLSAFSSFSL